MLDPTAFKNRLSVARSPAVPWATRDVVWGIITALLIIILFAVASELVRQQGAPLDPGVVVNLGTLTLLLPIWYFTIYKYGARWADLGLQSFQPQAAGLGCGLMLVFTLFNAVYAAILAQFGLRIQPDIAPIFADSAFPLVLFFGGAIVAPIVEEIFFRGFIFAGLRQRMNWKTAMFISAGLFGLAHVVLTSMLPIFLLGVLFAFLYQISGSIWPAILMHMLTNTLALSIAYAMAQGWIPAL